MRTDRRRAAVPPPERRRAVESRGRGQGATAALALGVAILAAAAIPLRPADLRAPRRAGAATSAAGGEDGKLARGKFLVARHDMEDTNFAETVVLLLRYDAGGAMGLVANRPSRVRLSELVPGIEGLDRTDPFVFRGGPVTGGELFLLVRADEPPEGSRPVLEDVHVSQSRSLLEELLADREARFRVYAGYAGWGAGQLDYEVARGDWEVVPATADEVFVGEPGGLWRRLAPRRGDEWARASGLDRVPGVGAASR